MTKFVSKRSWNLRHVKVVGALQTLKFSSLNIPYPSSIDVQMSVAHVYVIVSPMQNPEECAFGETFK